MVKRTKAIPILPIVVLVLALPLAQACMSPYDPYSVEVLLNKPGIIYNSSIEVPSIIKVDNMSFILRVWKDKEGPHVRVEIPLTRGMGAYWSYTGPVVITNGAIQRLVSRGWVATSITKNGSSIDVLQKGNVTIEITKPQSECTSDSDCITGGCSGELCLPKYMGSQAVSVCLYAQWYECFKLTSCGCVNGTCSWKPNEAFENCLKEHGINPSRVIRASVSEVTATGPNPEELAKALREFFNATGMNCTKLDLIAGSKEKPAYSPSEVDAGTVVRKALEYLMKNGTIVGLTEEDINQITSVAKWGDAGYNGKIGWYETENGTYAWIPYYKSPNATLVKCGGMGSDVTGDDNCTASTTPVNAPQNESASPICGPASIIGMAALVKLARRRK